MNTSAFVSKPRKQIVTMEEAARWRADRFLLQRKYDGDFQTRQYGKALLLGEMVRPKSGGFFTASDRALLAAHGSFFAAFTVADVAGQDMLWESTRTRWQELTRILTGANRGNGGPARNGSVISVASCSIPVVLAETVTDISATLAAGAEGVCAHEWDQPWGAMLCVKQVQTFYCVVTGFNGGTNSVQIGLLPNDSLTNGKCLMPSENPESLLTGHWSLDIEHCRPAGRVPLRSGKVDQVRIGSVLKVVGTGLTDAGMIREPRVCTDSPNSWLVRY